MKKARMWLCFVLVVVMFIAVTPGHAHALPETGCTGTATGRHTWVTCGRGREPTCTEGGSYQYQCIYCYQYAIGPDGEIPPLGHNWDSGTTTKQATCTEKGVVTHTCTRCGETKKEETSALGHNWDSGTVTKQATCTEKGSRTFKCTRCGTTKKEDIPKLNHDWKKETTEPDGMTDGQIVTTCRRCGETKTEIIPAAPAFFAALRTGGDTGENDCDMKIVQDPKGGTIARDSGESLPLTVVVEGGEEPYTYTWHYDSFDLSEPEEQNTALMASMIGVQENIESMYQGAAKQWYDSNAKTFDEVFNSGWMDLVTGKNSDVLETLLEHVETKNDKVATTDSPNFEADRSGDYWVDVRDNEGHILISDAARVYYTVRIGEQPKDVNLQTEADENGRVRMECKAADGSGVYKYEWFQYGSGEPCGTGRFYETEEPGDYFCRVTDEWTGDVVDSDTAEVYEAEPLRWYDITADAVLWPEEEWELNVTIEGGVPPYEAWWDRDDVPLLTQQGPDDAGGRATFYADGGVGAGMFTLHVTDDKGATLTAVTMRRDRELTIEKQPEGAEIPRNRSANISVTVSDGEAPYTYVLYCNGEELVQETKNSATGSFKVWTPGAYSFVIYDAKGHSAESKPALFADAVFHFTDYSLTAQLTETNRYARLFVEVDGGIEPYTYEWLERVGNGWRVNKRGAQSAYACYKPGTYACWVTDKEEKIIRTLDMTVTYTGDTPMIIQQPVSQLYQYSPGEMFTISCRAVCGTGKGTNLRYTWYQQDQDPTNGWFWCGSYKDLINNEPGLYKCVVEDISTGKSVESEYSLVREKLTIVSAELFCHDYPAQGWGTYDVHYEGGTGPYTIDVYLKGREDRGSQDILVDSVTVLGHYPRFYEPLWEKAVYKATDGMKSETIPTAYYFVVTSADGQKETSGLVRP